MQNIVKKPDGDSLLQDVVLRKPDTFAPGERPTVSLHLLAKNAETCLPRLLHNIGPYLDEVVAVLNDTTDGTADVLLDWCREQEWDREVEGRPAFRHRIFHVTSETHPDFYIQDAAETYELGRPLADEVLDGPFTGGPLLARWDEARNLGFAACTSDFILFLDADDEVLDPESIPGLCHLMNEQGLDLVATRYCYSVDAEGRTFSESYRERIARNRVGIHWECVTHEVLRGAKRTAYVDGNLIVVDHKDNSGEGVRVPGRCLKVLYHHARSRDWNVDARTLLYLGQEARVSAPELAASALRRYLKISTWPEERAWACTMLGEICEAAEKYEEASSWYELSLAEHPGSKAAYRLCRSRFAEKRWRDVVEAFEIGTINESTLQLLDAGAAFRDMTMILVASAHDKLGEADEALAMVEDAHRAFPESSELLLMRDQFRRQVRTEESP